MTNVETSRIIRWGMVGVLLIAAIVRLAALPELPLGLHYDEAANLILTRQIVDGGYRPIFIRSYTGKEPLFFYAAAPWVWMTGGAPWGLRLGAAMIGILTVAATFAATRALSAGYPAPFAGHPAPFAGHFPRSWVALFAAGWLAIAFPHILLSRYGFRAISQPLLQALVVATLWRGLRTGRAPWLVASGLALGLTAYTYLAARLFPVPLALALAWFLLRTPASMRARRVGHIALVLTVALVVFLPLGLFFAQNPETFLTRISQVASPTWSDALHGVGQCLQALIWPAKGDSYIRFNAPGAPILGPVAAGLALLGLLRALFARRVTALETAGRVWVISGVLVMTLPSALATGEITPSNLRMVGIYPMLAILPAWGLHSLLAAIASWGRPRLLRCAIRRRSVRISLAALSLLFLVAAWRTASDYRGWAASSALFRATDGEMLLAAEALDAAVVESEGGASADAAITVYIASEHYRHPTVAALAEHYARAKWLTGGATLVLPPSGSAVLLVPDSRRPPAPWPAAVGALGEVSRVSGPAGEGGITVTRLSAGAIATLRDEFRSAEPIANFAHVVWTYDAAPIAPCDAGEVCPILVIWEPRAPYPALQPVVRLLHPQTEEWARVMAFHYPPEQWTVGELILDQLVLEPPVEMPPGDAYQIGVGFYDAARDIALGRLVEERFAGFEARFPADSSGIAIGPAVDPPSPAQVAAACPGVPRDAKSLGTDLTLLGALVGAEQPLLPGRRLTVRLCWQAHTAAPDFEVMQLHLSGDSLQQRLYGGAPAGDYGFDRWRAGEVIETRHPVRVPRDIPSGDYALSLQLGEAVSVDLAYLTVEPITRRFDAPELVHRVDAEFVAAGDAIVRLLGYDLLVDAPGEAVTVTLIWQAMAEMAQDYVIFVHLRDATTDALLAQIDEMPQRVAAADGGRYPTSLWMPGEVVTDVHTLSLAGQDLSSPAVLYVGLYVPADGTHLSVGGERRLQLTRFPQPSPD